MVWFQFCIWQKFWGRWPCPKMGQTTWGKRRAYKVSELVARTILDCWEIGSQFLPIIEFRGTARRLSGEWPSSKKVFRLMTLLCTLCKYFCFACFLFFFAGLFWFFPYAYQFLFWNTYTYIMNCFRQREQKNFSSEMTTEDF